ncbi:MAG: hypothetical protein LBH28_01470, partial [Oscillospiraceae bacterium]|nr:hypothetical protein [Oscillospiraceae bacterium]
CLKCLRRGGFWLLLLNWLLGGMFRLVMPSAGHVSASKLVAGRLFKPVMPPAGPFSLREEK